ncbi:hypothetical protein O6H91_02G024400 [Diphasiastrum complanatum]|uniref:Uncharacterized protein n=1 Tax=Diphasiastrum complanatum TaxID=34168 RepID=A0ACC2EDM7_DIPCM|nr:hypothetical protein O6H91_02G024400 [Diphasiastrum complanatum]
MEEDSGKAKASATTTIAGKRKGKTALPQKRHKFKRFAERLEEVDVDVFRSLTPIKFEPSGGSSFFHENLVRWRELNAAADFIGIYEELLPLVQTLPQLVLHKETIVDRLLSRLHLSAMLSLEPILSLMAILSRDLREEFTPFTSRFIDACCELLQSGGDRETELLEQVFTSISYVIKYMLKFLTKDIKFVLRITGCLRHYHKPYVQEFAAEAVSFLLRKAPVKELVKGVRKLIAEVEINPSDEKIAGCSALFSYTLKSLSGLHSRAQLLLRLLLDETILNGVKHKGGKVALDVVAETLQRLCEDLDRDKLELVWNLLIGEIFSELLEEKESVSPEMEFIDSEPRITEVGGKMEMEATKDGNVSRLVQLFTLLNGMLEFRKGIRVKDFKPLFALAQNILDDRFISLDQEELQQTYGGPLSVSILVDDPGSMLLSETHRFLLGLIKSHSQVAGASTGPAAMSMVASSWAVAFDCNRPYSVLGFLKGVLEGGVHIVQPFTPHIVRALGRLLESHSIEVLPLFVDLFQKLNVTPYQLRHLLNKSEDIDKLVAFSNQLLQSSIQRIKMGWTKVDEGVNAIEILALEPAVVWTTLQCLPHITLYEEDRSTLAWEFAVSIEQFLTDNARDMENLDEDRADEKQLWECLLGAALKSHLKILLNSSNVHLEKQISAFLAFATSHARSVHVLAAVADFLDACIKKTNFKTLPHELQSEATISMLGMFGKNLSEPNKALRLATLQFLNSFEPLSTIYLENHHGTQRRQENIIEMAYEQHGKVHCQVMEHLLSTESAPFALENCRRSCILISRLKVDACKGRYPAPYLIPLTHAILGILYNRFTLLWDAAIDCLAGLMEEHGTIVWEVMLSHMVESHELALCQEENQRQDSKEEMTSKDIWARLDAYVQDFGDRTDSVTIVTLLLKALQRIPKFAESRSRHLVPLFLSFVDHARLRHESVLNKSPQAVRKYSSHLLQEWLNLLKGMKNARSLFRGPILKEVLLNRFIISMNPEIQEAAFDCLLNWKDPYLMPYQERLKSIFSSKTLREELTVWNVEREGHQVQDEHREGLIPILIKILYPKVVKMTSKSSGKSAGDLRKIVILPFLANLETKELALLFCLLLRPLQSAFNRDSGSNVDRTAFSWEAAIGQGVTSDFINWVDRKSAAALPHKKKLGFLNLVKDILDIFDDHHLEPYLHALLAFVLRFLEASPSTVEMKKNGKNSSFDNVSSFVDREGLEAADGDHYSVMGNLAIAEIDSQAHGKQLQNIVAADSIMGEDAESIVMFTAFQEACTNSMAEVNNNTDHVAETNHKNDEENEDQMKDTKADDEMASNIVFGARAIRTLCLKVICKLLSKFENLNLSPVYWEIFFQANESSIYRIKDESISSSTPGALFSCLLAMSKSLELASFLTCNKVLIPNVLSILSAKRASTSIISATLKFVENILHLENIDNGEGSSVVATMLIPNIPILLAGLQVRISTCEQQQSGKRIAVKREVEIISRLSKYINDQSQACPLVNALLPFLRTRKFAEQDSYLEILDIIKTFAQKLDAELIEKCLHLLGPLLTSLTFPRVRLAICTLIQEFARVQPSIKLVADILADMNAMSRTTVGEYDYDARLNAYARVTASFLAQLRRTECLLLLSHFVHDMASEDMSLRHSASNCLQLFVRFAATLSEDVDDNDVRESAFGDGQGQPRIDGFAEACKMLNSSLSSDKFVNSELCLSKPNGTKLLVQKYLLPIVRNAMGAELLATRREWVALLREMVVHFSDVSPFQELRSLIASDLEVDFFINIGHLQVHRRIKAMARFRTFCLPGQFSEGVLTRIFAPLFMTSLFEAKVDKEGNLVEAAIQSVGCIAAQLQWTPYFSLVMHCFRLIVSRVDYQKALVRLVCSILDQFHFYEESSTDVEMNHMVDDDVRSVQELPQVKALNVTTKGLHVQKVSANVHLQLQKRILPEISKFLVSKERYVNASVALAVVKVLKLMPHDIVEVELPRILQIMINFLKSRSQAVRDETRSALVSVAEALGARYLSYIVNMLKGSLTRGYELHVLGYTLNSILVKIVPTLNVGEIDYCLDQILHILEGDIFGEVAEEKDVKALAVRMKETKHMRSFESFKLIAQVTSFRLHGFTLLNPVRNFLPNSLSPKIRSKVELVLKHIATGIQSNPSISREDLFLFLHGLIEDGVRVDASAAFASSDEHQPGNEDHLHVGNADKIPQFQRVADLPSLPTNASVPNVHILTEFALNLFHGNIKRVKVSGSDGHTLSMLDPFVKLLEKCLYSSHDGVVCGAIKCLCFLLRLPLPATERLGTKSTTLLFSIAQRSGKSETPLMQACLNLLVVLLRHCQKTKFSQEHLRTLLNFPVFVDLEANPSPIALSLLKAIVGRKLLVPELYDMMTRVERLMVTSHMLPIRQQCSQILLQFLLDYPLGPKRLQQHLDFFISNLGYEHATGREAVLEMIHTVIVKFPETFLEEQVESLFFPMVTRLVNDDDNHIRALVGTVLKLLIGRASPQSLQRILEVCFSWLDEENRHLWRLGTQLMGFLIETMMSKFARHVDHALKAAVRVIEHLCLSKDNGEVQSTDMKISDLWEEVYFALTMVEKLYQQFPDLLHQPFVQNLWDLIFTLLLHQHVWVRKACLRIVGMYFIKCGTPDIMLLVLEPSFLQKALLMHPSRIILLAASICQQLDTGFFDEEMSEIIVKNMAFVTRVLHLLPNALAKGNTYPGLQQFLSCDDQISQKRISEAFILLEADKYRDGSTLLVNDPHKSVILSSKNKVSVGQKSESTAVADHYQIDSLNISEKLTNFVLLLVFRRLEKIGLRLHALQAKTVFKWFDTIATQLGGDAIQPYLHFMLRTLYKITEGSAAKVVPEDLKASGEEVLTHLREIVGVEKFLQVYNIIRQSVKERRENRKRSQKITVLVDPERHTKRKLHLIAKRRAQKKRKLGETRN